MPTYIVLGMHRSGTSAVAGMLDSLGVRMGPKNARADWVGRHWSNPMGHFENPDIVWLNGRILGYDGTGVHESPHWEHVPERARALAPEIDRTLRATEGDLWGWKDPWSVLTIEEFLNSPGVGAAIDTRPPSIWCVFNLALRQIIHLVWRVDPYPNFALADPALRRHLCDSPRKRRKQLSLAFTFR